MFESSHPLKRSALTLTLTTTAIASNGQYRCCTLSSKKNNRCRYNMENECPSCGFDKEYPEHTLCKYCYYRGTVGAAKFLLFQTMRDNGNKYLTVDELTELVNQNPNRKNKVKRDAVYKILHRYSRYYEQAKERRRGYLVLKKEIPQKKGQRGRPQIKYKLSSRLIKRVDYLGPFQLLHSAKTCKSFFSLIPMFTVIPTKSTAKEQYF